MSTTAQTPTTSIYSPPVTYCKEQWEYTFLAWPHALATTLDGQAYNNNQNFRRAYTNPQINASAAIRIKTRSRLYNRSVINILQAPGLCYVLGWNLWYPVCVHRDRRSKTICRASSSVSAKPNTTPNLNQHSGNAEKGSAARRSYKHTMDGFHSGFFFFFCKHYRAV